MHRHDVRLVVAGEVGDGNPGHCRLGRESDDRRKGEIARTVPSLQPFHDQDEQTMALPAASSGKFSPAGGFQETGHLDAVEDSFGTVRNDFVTPQRGVCFSVWWYSRPARIKGLRYWAFWRLRRPEAG